MAQTGCSLSYASVYAHRLGPAGTEKQTREGTSPDGTEERGVENS